MEGDHLSIVHFINVIPREDQDQVGPFHLQGVNVLKNGIGCPLIPVLINPLLGGNGLDEFPQRGGKDIPSQLDVTVEGGRFILGEGKDTADARIEAVGEGKVNDPINSTERNSRFGSITSERIESFPSAAR
jgi:hypothetical protein